MKQTTITFDYDYMTELKTQISAPFERSNIQTLQDRVNVLGEASAALLDVVPEKTLADLANYFKLQKNILGEQYGISQRLERAATYCSQLEQGQKILSHGATAEKYLRKYLHQDKGNGARLLTNLCLSVSVSMM